MDRSSDEPADLDGWIEAARAAITRSLQTAREAPPPASPPAPIEAPVPDSLSEKALRVWEQFAAGT